ILVTDLAKGSFPARAGIEKGDVVRRVAGHAIDTVDDAASAYAAVMKAKQVVVEIDRRGARLHITYQLTD
ncbi:MAG TPA: PDZ domain-containing protein, partial [Kofleriaceae bacterium]|nr:PDZ domain-containing protein [Kofleriaceae bacterium]